MIEQALGAWRPHLILNRVLGLLQTIQIDKRPDKEFSSVQSLSHVRLFATPMDYSMPGFPVQHQLQELTQTHVHGVGDTIHPTMSSSVISFSSCPQSFPASGPFPMSQFFTSGGQSIGVLASTSVLPMNTQDWFPLGWTGWISLQSKGLSKVFSNSIVATAVSSVQFSSVAQWCRTLCDLMNHSTPGLPVHH